jgi:hypothetical protein
MQKDSTRTRKAKRNWRYRNTMYQVVEPFLNPEMDLLHQCLHRGERETSLLAYIPSVCHCTFKGLRISKHSNVPPASLTVLVYNVYHWSV